MTAWVDDRRAETTEQRLRRVLERHFDPERGTPFWIERAAELGIDPLGDIQHLDDLAAFGDMTPEDLARGPLTDYIPREFHGRLNRFVLGQTGGTMNAGIWTAFREDEFHEAFVLPFVVAAHHVGFPTGRQWLYVGPTGPHIIGKVMRHLAGALGGADPFSVDFDPRWARRMAAGSFAQERYTKHVVDQAVAVIDNQRIGVLFTTPPLLERLGAAMSSQQRERIGGVHYGGTALSPQKLERFQVEVFPNAVHLSGYGNTLFGCCLELTTAVGRPLDYYPYGRRLYLELVDDHGDRVPDGAEGTVRFTRLDESMLIIRMRERDQAWRVPPPDGAPAGYTLPGVRNPRPHQSTARPLTLGLY